MTTRKSALTDLMVRTVGENLRTYREVANLPLKILADRVQISEEELAKIETGLYENKFSFPLLLRLAESLNIRLEDLFEHEDEYIKKYRFPLYFFELFENRKNKMNLKTSELCSKIDITQSEYWYYKSGRNIFPPEKLQNLLIVLKISAADLDNFEKEYIATHEEKDFPKPFKRKTKKAAKKSTKNAVITIQAPPPAEKPHTEAIDEVVKAYNFYKNVETYINELDSIIRSAQKLKNILQKNM